MGSSPKHTKLVPAFFRRVQTRGIGMSYESESDIAYREARSAQLERKWLDSTQRIL